MNEYEVSMMVMTAPRKASATAVPVIDAASEPLRAMAAVGAMMPTESAIASMTPNCGRSLVMNLSSPPVSPEVPSTGRPDCTYRSGELVLARNNLEAHRVGARPRSVNLRCSRLLRAAWFVQIGGPPNGWQGTLD